MLTALALLAVAHAPLAPCTAQPGQAAPVPESSYAVLHQDTPVELMALREVSTASATPGTIFKLRVNRPIEIAGGPTIPVGTMAFGQVLTARDAASLGKAGAMQARLLCIEFGTVVIPLEGDISAKGTGSGSAAAAVLLSGVVGLFHRGNNAKIKAGEILSGFVAADVSVARAAEPQPLSPPAGKK